MSSSTVEIWLGEAYRLHQRDGYKATDNTSSRWRWPGIWARAPGPTNCGCGSPTTPPICWLWTGRRISTRVTTSPPYGCRPTGRSGVNTRCSSPRCCAGTGCRWTRRRRGCCARRRGPARQAERLTPRGCAPASNDYRLRRDGRTVRRVPGRRSRVRVPARTFRRASAVGSDPWAWGARRR